MQAGSADPAGAPLTRRDTLLLLGLTLVAAVLRAHYASMVAVVEPDGAFYLRLAQDMLRGTGTMGFHPAWPPGYPLLVALTARLAVVGGGVPAVVGAPDLIESAGRAVSVVGGALLLPLVVLLARRTVGARAGWVAGLLVLAHPNLIEPSTQALTEMTFALALLASLTLLRRGAGAPRVALAGITAGGAFLVRPEGLLLIAGLALALLVGGVAGPATPGTRRGRALLFLLAAALVATPHVAHVSRAAGRLSFGAKSDYNLALAYAGHPGVPEIVRSRSEYNNLTGAPPRDGFPERIPAFRFAPFLVREPITVVRHVVHELPSAGSAVFELATLPVALLALFGAWRRRRAATAEERTWLLLWLAFVGLYALVFVYRRFFTGFLPLLLIPAAAAMSPPPDASPSRRRWGYAAVALLMVAGLAQSTLRGVADTAGLEQRRLGESLLRMPRGHMGMPGGVAARRPALAWHADLPILSIPEGDSAAIVAGAETRGADYLLLDARDLGRERPELRRWIESGGRPPEGWVELTHSGTGRERLLLYRRDRDGGAIKKEQVSPVPN